MKIVLFYHSLLSDWNHGNAHFLRGFATELIERGHDVVIYEPEANWSLTNLLQERRESPLAEFRKYYPALPSRFYRLENVIWDKILAGADLVIAHEWNDHQLVHQLGRQRRRLGHFRLLFHDTHHRSVTDPASMEKYDLSEYDGVLAFGETVQRIYEREKWAKRAWTWHEAADVRVFSPITSDQPQGDLVWIGNWGDDERTAELREFLLEPVRDLRLQARIHGVRYPNEAKASLRQAGIEYAGWLPNFRAPEVFSHFRVTVHVPRRPYVESLPGIPTIRPFEALACGIPLICSPWDDAEGLFRPGDYLTARNGEEMRKHLRAVLSDEGLARTLAARGRETIMARHTCSHRIDQLLQIGEELGLPSTPAASAA
jgi:spore maturation protein CgeB